MILKLYPHGFLENKIVLLIITVKCPTQMTGQTNKILWNNMQKKIGTVVAAYKYSLTISTPPVVFS